MENEIRKYNARQIILIESKINAYLELIRKVDCIIAKLIKCFKITLHSLKNPL